MLTVKKCLKLDTLGIMVTCSKRKHYVCLVFHKDLLVKEAHEGGLMGHFGIQKTFEILRDHFY